ncbi:MAG TPA: nucleoside 2-deoxyribosyltransferase [Thermoanaerobaculia bacterium]|nr:nucleoside 2-deoxyribosyltransferase [Thermoanaerobaculia bacterium]
MARTIYFSGSISGGREDLAMYRRIVGRLERDGHRVQAGTVTSAAVHDGGENLPAAEIFARDLRWMAEVAAAGGVLVAEVSRPSTGVGYEVAAARYRFGMAVICLWRPAFTRRCSGMVAGDPGLRLIEYADDSVEQMLADLELALR